MHFLGQYQNNTYSSEYRPVCLSRFDGWWPRELKDAKTPAEKMRADGGRYQWDYAMILMDRDSSTGYYRKWGTDWIGRYSHATATGYPAALLEGAVIQAAGGDIFVPPDLASLNVVGLKHNVAGLTEGSSGGVWVANYGPEEDAEHNIIISVTSFLRPNHPGISFGPIMTPDFTRLFEYVSRGCPG
jgi:hypothetical protein